MRWRPLWLVELPADMSSKFQLIHGRGIVPKHHGPSLPYADGGADNVQPGGMTQLPYTKTWKEKMDLSKLFPNRQPRKNSNHIPPASPRKQIHVARQTDSPSSMIQQMICYFNEALSPQNPSQTFNESQIKLLSQQVIISNRIIKPTDQHQIMQTSRKRS
ncbi:hypothetical protein O181_010156 [Austropuccinia psidii MF-1]|uniref:Uncharacterized protein n=1 Tax=Austropuccinia psidii MF-1 TaxID=1389203 RepID=A0A9Q3GK52_9BASI|nr:hypothetical protein [Austropuccinia psidii MF-1]